MRNKARSACDGLGRGVRLPETLGFGKGRERATGDEAACAPFRTNLAVLGRKPASLDHKAAASLPLTALTAWEMLYDRLQIPHNGGEGEALLMLGGAGPLDPALVREWMTLDWEGAYPGPATLRCGPACRATSTPSWRSRSPQYRSTASW